MTVPVQDRAATKSTRASRRVPVKSPDRSAVPSRSGARSTAAQRAYAKRNQRAAIGTSAPKTARGSRGARIPFVATVIGLLSVGLAITLLLTTRSAEDSYKLSAAKAYNQELVEQKAALERDSRAANSAPELARKAAAQGMIPARDVARLVVAEDGAVTVVGEPKPASGTPVVVPPPAASTPGPTQSVITGTTRGAGVATADLPPIGARAVAAEPAPVPAAVAPAPAPVVPAPAPVAPAPAALVGAPEQAATPQAVNPQQPAAQDEQLVPMALGEQAGNQGGPQ